MGFQRRVSAFFGAATFGEKSLVDLNALALRKKTRQAAALLQQRRSAETAAGLRGATGRDCPFLKISMAADETRQEPDPNYPDAQSRGRRDARESERAD